MRADFPTITPDVARRYIMRARSERNSVRDQIAAEFTGTMRRECAWCGLSMGTRRCVRAMHGTTSHGICDACAAINFPELSSQPGSLAGETRSAGDRRVEITPIDSAEAGCEDPVFPAVVRLQGGLGQRTTTQGAP